MVSQTIARPRCRPGGTSRSGPGPRPQRPGVNPANSPCRVSSLISRLLSSMPTKVAAAARDRLEQCGCAAFEASTSLLLPALDCACAGCRDGGRSASASPVLTRGPEQDAAGAARTRSLPRRIPHRCPAHHPRQAGPRAAEHPAWHVYEPGGSCGCSPRGWRPRPAQWHRASTSARPSRRGPGQSRRSPSSCRPLMSDRESMPRTVGTAVQDRRERASASQKPQGRLQL